jgi:3-oxoacyl-[acyl-carrier protein] reductase
VTCPLRPAGRIITIGSVSAERLPFVSGGGYAMTKAAVAGLTRGLARDLGQRGITVNTVQPGPTDTDMNPADGTAAAGMKSLMALGRYARGDEDRRPRRLPRRPEAGFVTGQPDPRRRPQSVTRGAVGGCCKSVGLPV